jgi:hypothetical protein
MKTKKDIEGQLKRLVGNTDLPLKADYNPAYGGCGKIFVAHCNIDKYCSEICRNSKKKEAKQNILRNIFSTVWHKGG